MEQNLYHFFLVIPPGFEQLAYEELYEKTGFKITTPEIELGLEDGVSLNTLLRIPTRILIRLSSFKVRDFPKLHHKISKITWRQWLWSESVDFHVSTKTSRLIHTGRIEKTARAAILKSLKAQPFKKNHLDFFNFPPQVYIRVEDDMAQVSLDTSYPPLYKRGFDKSGHTASIRENLASACWRALKSHLEHLESYNLIDPMCGSGSFLTEALELSKRTNFAFQGFPIFRKLAAGNSLIEIKDLCQQKLQCYGFDNNEKVIESNQTLFNQINWVIKDLFKTSDSTDLAQAKNNIVISNPPYNKRIKINQNIKQITTAMIEKYNPLYLGIIVQKDQLSQLKLCHYQIVSSYNFRNGGLPCQFIVFKQD